MPIPDEVKLGPLANCMFSGASWWCQDDFPSNQLWADELERVLSHLEAHGQLQRYLPNLRGKLTQRNGALAEARFSFFLCCNGFRITSWQPRGGSNSFGEFEIQWKSSPPIFVEIKAPTWEGELSKSEQMSKRKQAGKYQHAETRTLDTIGKVIEAIDKSRKQNKFAMGRPNLLVVYVCNLFVSPRELSPKIVLPKIQSALNKLPSLGAVIIFDAICRGLTIEYHFKMIENSTRHCSGKLPNEAKQRIRDLQS
jgi:hypothetical protein